MQSFGFSNLLFKPTDHYSFYLQAKTSLTTFPASAEIVYEPLGVVLVISAWNYPFRMFKHSILPISHVFLLPPLTVNLFLASVVY